MDTKFTRQEQGKVRQRLVLENIKRVFLSSLVSLAIVPIFMIVSKLADTEGAFSVIRLAMVALEMFSACTAITSYLLLQRRDIRMARFVYQSYWIAFEIFSFFIIYAHTLNGGKFTFYSVMLVALMVGPVMTTSEQMYCMVIQLVYAIFATIRFGINAEDAVNILVLNLILFGISRYQYRAITERLILKERAKESREAATVDQMTGLLNRRGMEKYVDSSFVANIRSRRRVSLLMIDIDDLKVYNDSFGGDRGDECIRVIANVIKQVVLRNTDVIVRLDGGKFVVYMEGGSESEVVAMADKVRKVVEGRRIPQGRRAMGPFVTVSIGLASIVPKSEREFGDLYEEAEDALMLAKNNGRNLTVYDAQIYGGYRQRAN